MFVTPSTGCSQCTPCPKEVTSSAAVTKEESAEFSKDVICGFSDALMQRWLVAVLVLLTGTLIGPV